MHALRMVMSGGIYVPPMALRRPDGTGMSSVAGSSLPHQANGAVPRVARPNEPSSGARSVFGVPPAAAASQALGVPRMAAGALPSLRLTPRQTEVLELLLQGQPNKLIARHLNLSVETVKDHVASLLRVLGVSSRTQAVLAVSQMMSAGASRVAGSTPSVLNPGATSPL